MGFSGGSTGSFSPSLLRICAFWFLGFGGFRASD